MVQLKSGVIRKLRERKCWSQEGLAQKAGVSVRTLQRLEAGEPAKMDTVAYVAEALEVAPNDILEFREAAANENGNEGKSPSGVPIPVVVHRIEDGGTLLSLVSGSDAMYHDARALVNAADSEIIGPILDTIRDYLDIASEISITDRLRLSVELTGMVKEMSARGWWLLAGQKRHFLCSTSPRTRTPWVTCVVLAARADDSIIIHRQDADPVALVVLPERVRFQ